jgi:hypothetical protein
MRATSREACGSDWGMINLILKPAFDFEGPDCANNPGGQSAGDSLLWNVPVGLRDNFHAVAGGIQKV